MKSEIKQRIEQIRHGEVPDGYKMTLFGVVPKEWTISRIDEICRLSSGSTPKRDNSENFKGDILWITSGELKNKIISDTNEKINEVAAKSSHLEMYEQGTVVIAIYGLEAEGVRGTASIIAKKCTISQACMAFTNFKNVYNEYFYYWYIKNGQIIGLRYAQGTKQQNLSSEIVGAFPFCFPKEEEQQKIAKILTTQDKVIELYEKKIEQLQLLKKICLRKMFPKQGRNVPEVRFPGFTEPWEQRKAKDLFESTVDKNHPELPVLAATQEYGMVKRDDNGINIYHDKRNESTYKRVLPGQFVIHLRSFQGGFAHSSIEGITSPAYTVFGFKESEKHYDIFWKYIFRSDEFIQRLETVTYGIRDGRSISYEEFLTMNFLVPSFEEQKQISTSLLKLDHLITLHQRRCDEEKRKKKVLMQLLLTGIVRV